MFLHLYHSRFEWGGFSMFHWLHCTISFLLIFCTTWFSGCRNGNAQSVPAQPSAAAAQGPRPTGAKHALHDSAFSTYNNPNYGVTFRYPRNYFLDDAFGPENAPILEARQKLAAQQPGATLVATVTIPPDSYPNTTFVNCTLQLIVNTTGTTETCHSFPYT